MKIQLTSSLPFSPVQLDAKHVSPRRVVGQIQGMDGDREYTHAVYQFRHSNDDQIHYQIDPNERVYLSEDASSTNEPVAVQLDSIVESLVWVEHDDTLTYKPYAFLVMNAMTKLVGDWDGVVYRTPSGERLRESAWHATLQVIDACVCNKFGLWVMVNLIGEKGSALPTGNPAVRQLGWIPL
jgi:hypothetical protein